MQGLWSNQADPNIFPPSKSSTIEALEVLRKEVQDKVEVKIWKRVSEEEVETYLAVQVDKKTLLTNLEHQVAHSQALHL